MLLFAGMCYAGDWVLTSNEDDRFVYFKSDSVRIDGNMRKFWVMDDFKKEGELGGKINKISTRNKLYK